MSDDANVYVLQAQVVGVVVLEEKTGAQVQD